MQPFRQCERPAACFTPNPVPPRGSYALLIDPAAGDAAGAELVRIQRRDGERMSSASRCARAPAAPNESTADQLIDATPLTSDEQRTFHHLDRALHGRRLRTPQQKDAKALRDRLHQRMVYAPVLARLLRQAQARVDQQAA
jgi:hypothetical protein